MLNLHKYCLLNQVLKDEVIHQYEMGKYQEYDSIIKLYKAVIMNINEHNKRNPNDQFYLGNQLQILEGNIKDYNLSIESASYGKVALKSHQDYGLEDFC